MSVSNPFSFQEFESFDDLDQILLLDLNTTYPFDSLSFSEQTTVNEEGILFLSLDLSYIFFILYFIFRKYQ